MRKLFIISALCIVFMAKSVAFSQVSEDKMPNKLIKISSFTTPSQAKVDEGTKSFLHHLEQTLPFNRQFEVVKGLIMSTPESIQIKDTIYQNVRNYIGLYIYNYFMHSKLMGAETVAVQMVDSLYSKHILSMPNDIDLLNAKIFAEFNRQSLIGNKAPILQMQIPCDGSFIFPEKLKGSCSIIYFYAPNCNLCKETTPNLVHLLDSLNYKITLYAVNVEHNREEWEDYINTNFNFTSPNISCINLWDPNNETDFHKVYGVIQTPKLFLLDDDNTIIGRNLDVAALKHLLTTNKLYNPYIYGTQEADNAINNIITSLYKDTINTDNLLTYALHYYNAYISKQLHKEQYKEAIGDYLYYLFRYRFKGNAYLQAARRISEAMVLNDKADTTWNGVNDKVQVVALAQRIVDLDNALPLGKKAPNIVVHGVIKHSGYNKNGRWNLSKINTPTMVVFYSKECSKCKNFLAYVDNFLKSENLSTEEQKYNFLLVDVDKIAKTNKKLFDKLIYKFDFASLPFVFTINNKGIVQEKYINID